MPKLTPERWAEARARWEGDPKAGYRWLIEAMGLSVSGPAVRKKAIAQGWKKAVARPAGNFRGEAVSGNLENRSKVSVRVSALAGLKPREALFVMEYLADMNGGKAAARAGYSLNGVEVTASKLLRKAKVQAAISELQADRMERLEIDADARIRKLQALADIDINELIQYRRHCWGIGHAYQCTPAEFARARIAHEKERAQIKAVGGADIGAFPAVEGDWWDKRKPINPECPECFGVGLGEVFVPDTRTLSATARAAFEGVKIAKGSLEVLTFGKAKAEDMLCKALGLYREKDVEVNVNAVDAEALSRVFIERMKAARERQAEVLRERGLNDD